MAVLFSDLLTARDSAIALDESAAAAVSETETAIASAQSDLVARLATRGATTAAVTAANADIHNLLTTNGEYYLIDNRGTLTVYKAIDADPGYVGFQPIPGTEPPATPAAKVK
jgi:hypothetical protein